MSQNICKLKVDLSSPKKEDELFTDYWDIFVLAVSERDNFREDHLNQLSILCDLYVEYDQLQFLLKEEGYTIVSETKFGVQVKAHPCVNQKIKIVSEIRAYTRMLDLTLSRGLKSSTDGDEWE